MASFLFVHFREKTTPDGEQVYFALSRDGLHWEAVNEGRPVLWSYYGSKGVRDHTIIHDKREGNYHIFSTDLSLAYGMRNQYHGSWQKIKEQGSKYLSHWTSPNLLDWSKQTLIQPGNDALGCLWAPDILYDKATDDYVLHWSSSHQSNNYTDMCIYFSRTKDFLHYSPPEILYRKNNSSIIDSAIYEENDIYYLFVKSDRNPNKNIMLKSNSITGPYERVKVFDESTADLEGGMYEGLTAVQLDDGRWVMFLDYYGMRGDKQGYIPFIADSLAEANFKRADDHFSFPYGLKHGTILRISDEEHDLIRRHDFNVYDYSDY